MKCQSLPRSTSDILSQTPGTTIVDTRLLSNAIGLEDEQNTSLPVQSLGLHSPKSSEE